MQNANDQLSIVNTKKVLDVKHADLDGSQFETVKMCHAQFKQVWMASLKIVDANLSDLEIDGAQIGGAYIHHIGMPRKGNPAYVENAKQRPVRFEDCELEGSTITNCDLKHVAFNNCDMEGATINGILITDLLDNYHK